MADDSKTQTTAASQVQTTVTSQAPSRIPAHIAQKYPDLEALMAQTESMTDEERDYWYQIMPIMTDEQVQKLRGILMHEKEQLAQLDAEYEVELSKLNEKHLLEWKEHEAKEKRTKRQHAESLHEAEEKAQEASLLAQLNSIDDDTNG